MLEDSSSSAPIRSASESSYARGAVSSIQEANEQSGNCHTGQVLVELGKIETHSKYKINNIVGTIDIVECCSDIMK